MQILRFIRYFNGKTFFIPMKKLFSLYGFPVVCLLVASSCYRAPEFPAEPTISFENLQFYDTPSQDSLVLTINFEDGDGDLGLGANEIDQPYNPFSFVPAGNNGWLQLSSNDTMPPFSPPYSCVNYKLGKIDETNAFFVNYYSSSYSELYLNQAPDTFYTEPNMYTDNFLVDFYVKRNGNFEYFDWITAPSSGCGESMNGRFTPLFDDDNPDKPLSGDIIYAMENFGFIPYFRNDTLKLSIRIIDRALHVSNVIETPEFYFRRVSDRYQIEFLE